MEGSAEVVSGKVPLAMPAIGKDGEAKKYPSMPCLTSEQIQHTEKAVKAVRFFDALVSDRLAEKRCTLVVIKAREMSLWETDTK